LDQPERTLGDEQGARFMLSLNSVLQKTKKGQLALRDSNAARKSDRTVLVMADGSRSVSELASLLRLSPATVVESAQRLIDDGMLVPRDGAALDRGMRLEGTPTFSGAARPEADRIGQPGAFGVEREAEASAAESVFPDHSGALLASDRESAGFRSNAGSAPGGSAGAQMTSDATPPSTVGVVIDEAALSKLTLLYASYIGPMAAVLIRQESRAARDADELIERLAQPLGERKERDAFAAAARSVVVRWRLSRR